MTDQAHELEPGAGRGSRRVRAWMALVSLGLLAVAPGSVAGPFGSGSPPHGPSRAGRPGDGIAALPVVSGLSLPIFVTAPADDERLFVVEQEGSIRIVEDGAVSATPFLELSTLVVCCGERGLLGLAFAPDYAASGVFYVNYTASGTHPDAPGVAEGDTVIERYQVSADPDVADAGSREPLLSIAQPFANHNGGTLAFGPDGMLWIGMGDGGGGGDPEDNAQDLTTLLGKMLRIDVSDGPGNAYTVPLDNPFVGDPPLDEIWALGLRNPYRFSFDRDTGDLYIADVGQNSWEEVNAKPANDPGGRNYGWDCKEGTNDYVGPPDESSPECAGRTLTPPVHEYAHVEAPPCSGSVTGGYVYRGGEVPAIQGHYFFADFCQQKIWSFVWDGAGGIVGLRDRTAELTPIGGGSIDRVSAFGEDGLGELYIVDRGTGSDGEIFKIVPAHLRFFLGDE